MSGKAAKIILTEKQQLELKNIKRSMVCPQRLIQRSTIILLAFEGMLNTQNQSVGRDRSPTSWLVASPLAAIV